MVGAQCSLPARSSALASFRRQDGVIRRMFALFIREEAIGSGGGVEAMGRLGGKRCCSVGGRSERGWGGAAGETVAWVPPHTLEGGWQRCRVGDGDAT